MKELKIASIIIVVGMLSIALLGIYASYKSHSSTPAEQRQRVYYDCVRSSVVNHVEEKIKYCDDIK